MDIVILGAGSIGSYLAATLSQEGHNIIVIDHAAKPLERLAETADVATRLGSGTDCRLLEEILEYSPSLFIAVSSDDETNLVACSLAKNLGYPKTVARVRQGFYLNRSKLDFARLFFVDHLIGTELIVAHDILQHLFHHEDEKMANFAHGSVQMRTLVIPTTWKQEDQKLAELKLPQNLLISLIRRARALIFPTGSDSLIPGDEVTIIGETKAMVKIPEIFGVEQRKIKSALIIGGSNISLHTCKLLEEYGTEVKILESDEAVCRRLAEQLPRATILCHEITDIHFLLEEKLVCTEALICASASHETNVLMAAIGKQMGCPHVVPLVSEEGYFPFLHNLGITTIVSERVSISNRIHALIQMKPLFSISPLYENQAKIMEIKVSSDSQIVGIPLVDLRSQLPKDFLFALIENRGRVTIPKGNHILAPGDSVIVLCDPKHLPELEKIF
ncbi:MAG: Trk system potassium transporter TrkA [Chlamydiales bacterium]